VRLKGRSDTPTHGHTDAPSQLRPRAPDDAALGLDRVGGFGPVDWLTAPDYAQGQGCGQGQAEQEADDAIPPSYVIPSVAVE